MNSRISQIIEKLELEPHPEGGYFKETYRSSGEIEEKTLGPDFKGKRNFSTCIYFLLTSNDFSAFHRIKQDEIWHFYDGSPIRLHVIAPSGEYSKHRIGRELALGETPQLVVPAGCWFAAEVVNESAFSLVGCTVSPGFDFRDFEMGSRPELISLFPEHEKIISKLTRD
ncbi:MAG: cupin domain-containing protein [Lutimonas sp.]